MRVRIAQCICPERHTLLAATCLNPEVEDKLLLDALRGAVSRLRSGEKLVPTVMEKMQPWCGICGAAESTWIYEVAWSKEFESAEHALAELTILENANIASRNLLHALGLTYDARRKTEMN